MIGFIDPERKALGLFETSYFPTFQKFVISSCVQKKKPFMITGLLDPEMKALQFFEMSHFPTFKKIVVFSFSG